MRGLSCFSPFLRTHRIELTMLPFGYIRQVNAAHNATMHTGAVAGGDKDASESTSRRPSPADREGAKQQKEGGVFARAEPEVPLRLRAHVLRASNGPDLQTRHVPSIWRSSSLMQARYEAASQMGIANG
jgi:hypothetical protein